MKTKRRILSDRVAEAPPETFSNAIAVGRTIYVAGQHAGEPDGTIVGEHDVGAQATRAFEKIAALLEAAGATMDDVVKLGVFLTDVTTRKQVGEARRAFFTGDFPCSTLVGISALAQPGLLVEIDAIAVRGCSGGKPKT
jgi:enamine deaminase RidA (YjgF/YER057c/UK114 family)